MTMPMSSRRSFMSTAAIAAVTSVSGCAVTAPAAAAICRAAPYVPALDAPPFATAATEANTAAPSAAMQGSAVADKALDLAARFRREHAYFHGLPDDTAEEVDSRAYDAWAKAAADCYAMPPVTPAGALAFVSVMIDREYGSLDNEAMAALVVLRNGLAAMVQS